MKSYRYRGEAKKDLSKSRRMVSMKAAGIAKRLFSSKTYIRCLQKLAVKVSFVSFMGMDMNPRNDSTGKGTTNFLRRSHFFAQKV